MLPLITCSARIQRACRQLWQISCDIDSAYGPIELDAVQLGTIKKKKLRSETHGRVRRAQDSQSIVTVLKRCRRAELPRSLLTSTSRRVMRSRRFSSLVLGLRRRALLLIYSSIVWARGRRQSGLNIEGWN